MRCCKLPTLMILLMLPSLCGAIELSATGAGQVLFFPYFTVNGGNQTLVTVKNEIPSPVAVRVRFRDGRTGESALDLNVYLRSSDSWVAAIALDAQSGSASLVIPADESTCALPNRADLSLGMVREGFIEVIKMGDIARNLDTGVLPEGEGLADAIDAGDCEVLAAAWEEGGAWSQTDGKLFVTDFSLALADAAGQISGTGSLVNVAAGWSATYQATAIDEFFLSAADPVGDLEQRPALHFAPGDPRPTLLDANTEALTGSPDVIRSTAVFGDQRVELDWQRESSSGLGAIDAVSAVLITPNIDAEFTVESDLDASTELVLTMPTIHHYAAGEEGASSLDQLVATAQLANREGDLEVYNEQIFTGPCLGYCTRIETESASTAVIAVMQPEAGSLEPDNLGSQAARLNEAPTRLLQSTNSTSLPRPETGLYDSGSVLLRPSGELPQNGEVRLRGLPIIGFRLTVLTNGTLVDESGNRVLSTYALSTPLRRFSRSTDR